MSFLFNLMTFAGMMLLMVGASMMDSENLVIPFVVLGLGILMMIPKAVQEELHG